MPITNNDVVPDRPGTFPPDWGAPNDVPTQALNE